VFPVEIVYNGIYFIFKSYLEITENADKIKKTLKRLTFMTVTASRGKNC